MSPSAEYCRRAGSAGALGLLLAAAVGCGDASTDPMAVLVAAETHGALDVTEDLPSLPELIQSTGSETALPEAADTWLDSWDAGDDGLLLRQDAYRQAVPRLATALGADGIAAALMPVRSTVQAGATLPSDGLPDFVVSGVLESGALVEEADQALSAGELGRALLFTLEAADLIRALGPEEVARDLLERADEVLGRKDVDRAYSPLELERARHLLLSGSEAMGHRDYIRAIRRAFYACEILGVELR